MLSNTILSSYLTETQTPEPKETLVRKPKALPLRFHSDPILTRVCDPIGELTPELRALAYDMILTLMVEGGLGLAAPQVGTPLRLIVLDEGSCKGGEPNHTVIFNPSFEPIEDLDGFGEHDSLEGCLSLPRASAKVKRYRAVRVRGLDLNGYGCSFEARRTLSAVVQHEVDHLNGITIASKVSTYDMMMSKKAIKLALRRQKAEAKKRR